MSASSSPPSAEKSFPVDDDRAPYVAPVAAPLATWDTDDQSSSDGSSSDSEALAFHPAFEVKLSDDAIVLRSTGGICFYYSYHRLAQLSSFFHNIPATILLYPAIIDLPQASTEVLAILLEAIKLNILRECESAPVIITLFPDLSFPAHDGQLLCFLEELLTAAGAYDLGLGLWVVRRALRLHLLHDPLDMFAFLAVMGEDDEAIEISAQTLSVGWQGMSDQAESLLLKHRPSWYRALRDLHQTHERQIELLRVALLTFPMKHMDGWKARCTPRNGSAGRNQYGCATWRQYRGDYACFRADCADALLAKVIRREFDLRIAMRLYFIAVDEVLAGLVRCKQCRGKMSEALQLAARKNRELIDWKKKMEVPRAMANTRGRPGQDDDQEQERCERDTVPDIFNQRPDPRWSGEKGEDSSLIDRKSHGSGDESDGYGDLDSLAGMDGSDRWSDRGSV